MAVTFRQFSPASMFSVDNIPTTSHRSNILKNQNLTESFKKLISLTLCRNQSLHESRKIQFGHSYRSCPPSRMELTCLQFSEANRQKHHPYCTTVDCYSG